MKNFVLMLVAAAVGFVGFQYVENGYELDLNDPFAPKAKTPEELLKSLEKSEAALTAVYENLPNVTPERAGEVGSQELARISSNYQQLGELDITGDLERQAQMSVLRSHYLAVKMLPSMLDPFQCQAKRVMSLRPESEDAAVARILLFCAEHTLNEPDVDQLVKEIGDEANSYEQTNQAIALYSAVAHECWKNGDAESSEKVLESGIERFRNSQGKLQLVTQLIDQGHRQPPEQFMTQAQYRRMQRAMEQGMSGSGVQFRS